jgi:hypothetical protein
MSVGGGCGGGPGSKLTRVEVWGGWRACGVQMGALA